MTMVPSSVDISCMPVIAMIAVPSTFVDSGAVVRSVDPGDPPTQTWNASLPRAVASSPKAARRQKKSGASRNAPETTIA